MSDVEILNFVIVGDRLCSAMDKVFLEWDLNSGLRRTRWKNPTYECLDVFGKLVYSWYFLTSFPHNFYSWIVNYSNLLYD